MIERGISGCKDERRCLKEQMNGSDSERWHGLLQKNAGGRGRQRKAALKTAEEKVG